MLLIGLANAGESIAAVKTKTVVFASPDDKLTISQYKAFSEAGVDIRSIEGFPGMEAAMFFYLGQCFDEKDKEKHIIVSGSFKETAETERFVCARSLEEALTLMPKQAAAASKAKRKRKTKAEAAEPEAVKAATKAKEPVPVSNEEESPAAAEGSAGKDASPKAEKKDSERELEIQFRNEVLRHGGVKAYSDWEYILAAFQHTSIEMNLEHNLNLYIQDAKDAKELCTALGGEQFGKIKKLADSLTVRNSPKPPKQKGRK